MRGMSVASTPNPRIVMVHPKPSGGFEWTQAEWGPVLRCRPLADIAAHFFTAGNLELRDSGHEWDAVAREIGVGFDRVLLLRQVHGTDVSVARMGHRVPLVTRDRKSTRLNSSH